MPQHPAVRSGNDLTVGERVADTSVKSMGSWTFILVQAVLMALWMAANVMAGFPHWDHYPYVLLNLALSTQAAFAAPLILLAGRRQDTRNQEVAVHTMRAVDDLNAKLDTLISELQARNDGINEQKIPPAGRV